MREGLGRYWRGWAAGRVVCVMKSYNDEELMERIRARDERALEFFIKRFRPMLRSIAGKILWNDQDIGEVVDEVFLAIWNQSANFDPSKGKAIGWIVTMV